MSEYGVIRGLHYQIDQPQGKLVFGSLPVQSLDVAVDLRRSSSTFGNWFTIELSSEKYSSVGSGRVCTWISRCIRLRQCQLQGD
ncbi:MAG: dTDP-4-dehydrorhamnose 3,5-epimerase family protein [Woeseiaceae bacterium]|nr:dTDP-4-dehydrorhamnose 3,5-epimerase family protein [Woeseiaceae bacterium]